MTQFHNRVPIPCVLRTSLSLGVILDGDFFVNVLEFTESLFPRDWWYLKLIPMCINLCLIRFNRILFVFKQYSWLVEGVHFHVFIEFFQDSKRSLLTGVKELLDLYRSGRWCYVALTFLHQLFSIISLKCILASSTNSTLRIFSTLIVCRLIFSETFLTLHDSLSFGSEFFYFSIIRSI
jgi:hypothetical protein